MRSTVRPRWSRVPEPTCRASLSDASNSRTHASPLSRSTVSWRGAVLFHLSADDQRSGLEDVAEWLTPGGRFLFTSGDLEGKRDGLMDGVPFHHVTLGVARYSQAIEGAGMQLLTHHCDAWDNHVYLAERPTVLETTHATSRTTAEPSEERSRPSLRTQEYRRRLRVRRSSGLALAEACHEAPSLHRTQSRTHQDYRAADQEPGVDQTPLVAH